MSVTNAWHDCVWWSLLSSGFCVFYRRDLLLPRRMATWKRRRSIEGIGHAHLVLIKNTHYFGSTGCFCSKLTWIHQKGLHYTLPKGFFLHFYIKWNSEGKLCHMTISSAIAEASDFSVESLVCCITQCMYYSCEKNIYKCDNFVLSLTMLYYFSLFSATSCVKKFLAYGFPDCIYLFTHFFWWKISITEVIFVFKAVETI